MQAARVAWHSLSVGCNKSNIKKVKYVARMVILPSGICDSIVIIGVDVTNSVALTTGFSVLIGGRTGVCEVLHRETSGLLE